MVDANNQFIFKSELPSLNFFGTSTESMSTSGVIDNKWQWNPIGNDYTPVSYTHLLDTWHHAAWEMVTAPSSQQVESLWAQLMQELSTAGLDAMESAMTARFADALERYHAAGYFTDIQP